MQREHFTRMNPVAVMRMNVTEDGEELKERVLYRNELDGKGQPLCLPSVPTSTHVEGLGLPVQCERWQEQRGRVQVMLKCAVEYSEAQCGDNRYTGF